MPNGIPNLRGIEHVGLVVPDINQATSFLNRLLGVETIYDVGPFDEPQDWMAHHLAKPYHASIHRMRMLKVNEGALLELIEFTREPGNGSQSRHNHVSSGVHVAFYVDDMEAALAELKAQAITILSGPVEMTEGPSAGLTWLYFEAPWGQQLELVSYPNGMKSYREHGVTSPWMT